MKNLILGFVLLTSSLGAHASMECSIQTLKPTFAGMAIVISTQKLQFEDNSHYNIDNLVLGSIKSKSEPYRYQYMLNGEVECSIDGQCTLEGKIRKAFLKTDDDGIERFINADLYGDYFKVTKNDIQDFVLTSKNKTLNLRMECK